VTNKLGICITKSSYQTVGTICCRCCSCFRELLFRAIPVSCRGIGGFYDHYKRTDVLLSGIDPPTSAEVGAIPGNWHLCENVKLEIGNRGDEIVGSHQDWSEQWGAYHIYKFTTSVRDGARVRHKRPTGPGLAFLDSRISTVRETELGFVIDRRPGPAQQKRVSDESANLT
jgi:hypothetical protein